MMPLMEAPIWFVDPESNMRQMAWLTTQVFQMFEGLVEGMSFLGWIIQRKCCNMSG